MISKDTIEQGDFLIARVGNKLVVTVLCNDDYAAMLLFDRCCKELDQHGGLRFSFTSSPRQKTNTRLDIDG